MQEGVTLIIVEVIVLRSRLVREFSVLSRYLLRLESRKLNDNQ